MTKGASFVAMLTLLASTGAESFELGDAEIARLGIEVASVESASHVAVAAGPAEVVVPPAQLAVVSAPTDGLIARLVVAAGDTVARGQPIAELDSAEFLDWQRAYLEAEGAAELARAQLARDRGLFDDGVIAERRVQEATAIARVAELKVAQAGEQLRLAGLDDRALQDLGRGRALTARLVLRAPLDGTIAAAHAKVGARVGRLDPVVTIADPRTLWLELHLREADAARVELGQTAAITVRGAEHTGPITAIARIVDPTTQTVLVRAVIDNSTGALRAGLLLEARVTAPAEGIAFALPAGAVTRAGGAAYVFVREPTGFEARRVEVLAEDGEHIYVDAGIDRGGLRVAVGGINALKALWLAAQEAEG